MMPIKKLKIVALILSILLFIISLTQPAFYIDRSDPDGWANSIGLLLIGWTGTLAGGAGLAWLANPLLLFSWIFFFKKPKVSLRLSVIATFFAASFLMFHKILTDEAGNYSTITVRKAGYWFWLSSTSLFSLCSILLYYRYKDTVNTNVAHL